MPFIRDTSRMEQLRGNASACVVYASRKLPIGCNLLFAPDAGDLLGIVFLSQDTVFITVVGKHRGNNHPVWQLETIYHDWLEYSTLHLHIPFFS